MVEMAVFRRDGRRTDELREVSISYEGLDRADGSARFGFGNTKALSSVSGPIEVRLASEQPSQATLEVLVRPLANIPGTESKALSATLRSLLAHSLLLYKNPRTLIQLVTQSVTPMAALKYHNSLVAAMINASIAALLNAGSISMRGVACAVAIGRMRAAPLTNTATLNEGAPAASSHSLVLVSDPSEEERDRLEGGGCFAFLFAAGLNDTNPSSLSSVPSGEPPECDIVWTNWQATTAFDVDELHRATELARAGAKQVWRKLRASVKRMEGAFVAEADNEADVEMEEAHESDVNSDDDEDDDQMEI